MTAFKYQAMTGQGDAVSGEIEAEDRRSALQLLGRRGLYPSRLDPVSTNGRASNSARPALTSESVEAPPKPAAQTWTISRGISRKQVTAFTRQMAALLGASIPIPQALEGLGDEEEVPALRELLQELSIAVRSGTSFSGALAKHPKCFGPLYISMVRVGEEAGALPSVMVDLADLLEHEDEVRSEVVSAIAYPVFVLGFGVVTVAILLTVVLPRLFSMLQEMLNVLPLPTLILLRLSGFLNQYWWVMLLIAGGTIPAWRAYVGSPRGAETVDRWKLKIPMVGSMLRSAALGRFAHTLGILVKSGVSLLPSLKIVEATMGNQILARQVAQVAEQTRGGSSLATPLRQFGLFPKSVIQMIAVGEETGKLAEMLLKVATIEERQMRARTKTLISLLAPALILIVGAIVGFMVIALLLPIFKMSRGIH
jgi:type II secretory pathway component PulF